MINLIKSRKVNIPPDVSRKKFKKTVAVLAVSISLSSGSAFAGKLDYVDYSSIGSSNTSLSAKLKSKMGNKWNSYPETEVRNYQPNIDSKEKYKEHLWVKISRADISEKYRRGEIDASSYPIYFE